VFPFYGFVIISEVNNPKSASGLQNGWKYKMQNAKSLIALPMAGLL